MNLDKPPAKPIHSVEMKPGAKWNDPRPNDPMVRGREIKIVDWLLVIMAIAFILMFGYFTYMLSHLAAICR